MIFIVIFIICVILLVLSILGKFKRIPSMIIAIATCTFIGLFLGGFFVPINLIAVGVSIGCLVGIIVGVALALHIKKRAVR